jgi:cytochrome c553
LGSNNKKRQTMAKHTRERAVKERRALKQEKKEARKLAAAYEQLPEPAGEQTDTPVEAQ